MTGKDLIQMGYKPAKWFAEALTYANSQPRTEQELRNYIGTLQPKQYEPLLPQHLTNFTNPESQEESDNIIEATADMLQVLTTPTLVHGQLMPDACPTGQGQIPVGGVVSAKNAIHPGFHSADICCSLMASNLGNTDPKEALNKAHRNTFFGPGMRYDFSLPYSLKEQMERNPFFTKRAIELAEGHLGTQGDGNHFLSVGRSKNTGDTYLVTHHGSRGMGAAVYKEGMRVAERFRREIAPKVDPKYAWIPFDTKEGKDYWEALQIVKEWTRINHDMIHLSTIQPLGIGGHGFWNTHNFVYKEGDLFHHAKGATPMFESSSPKIIPMNMAENILIVMGGSGFAPHGAGRNYSRSEHKRRQTLTKEEQFAKETEGLDVRFYSGNIDVSELPSAYKSAESVKRQIKKFNLCEIIDEIVPYGCIMAGEVQHNKKKC